MELDEDGLIEAIDLALFCGRLMLQYGAETEKVEQSVHNIGKVLGCVELGSIITHNSIILTASNGKTYHTKIIKVIRQGVNYEILSLASKVSYAAYKHKITAAQIKDSLEEIEHLTSNYGRFTTLFMVSASCGAFSILFGGDGFVFLFAFLASFVGLFIRMELIKRQFNPLLTTLISAFFATVISGVSIYFIDKPELVFASSVLFLIPGVQLINSAEDLIKGHFVVGFTRGFMGILTSLAIAFGITFGFYILGGNI